jgi:pyridoxine 5'-phosphate synthase PdxJ
VSLFQILRVTVLVLLFVGLGVAAGHDLTVRGVMTGCP